ncbi:hypothetical protein N7535_008872 [Penicillium sp. DV-2018c]|nr:hypothetical protein N7535_008872 [Penicillium sp. DV-2018c]
MLFIPATAVEREEKIRAFWATEALDSISTLGAAWNLSVSRPEPAATVPCDDEIWLYPESVLATYLFGNVDAPSSFSLFVSLATNELWRVHHFLQESYNQKTALDFHQRQDDCNTIYQRLMSWQADFERVLAIHSPPYADLFPPVNAPDSIQTAYSSTVQSTVLLFPYISVSSFQWAANLTGASPGPALRTGASPAAIPWLLRFAE